MAATRLQAMPEIINARKSGKKTVLIDVCGEAMSKYCDKTILIRPGTDGALALAMMNVLVKEGLADEEFLDNNAEGYRAFKRCV